MWLVLGTGALVAVGWLVVAAVARRLTEDLAYLHEHPMTVLRRDESRCWSCDLEEAVPPEGLCAKCAGGLLHAS